MDEQRRNQTDDQHGDDPPPHRKIFNLLAIQLYFLPNSFSISPWPSFTHVGRPWLHWPERGVTSISRSSAFISATESTRPARTEPWQAMVAATWSSLSRRLKGPPSPVISESGSAH